MAEPRILNLTPEHIELINAGFAPARYGVLVRLARRVLWPLIRPFHFYTLERTQQQQQPPQAAAPVADTLAGELAALRRVVATTDDLRALIFGLAALRAEVTALTNRHVWGEQAIEDMQAALGEVATLRSGAAQSAETIAALAGALATLRDAAGHQQEQLQTLADQQRVMQDMQRVVQDMQGVADQRTGAAERAAAGLQEAAARQQDQIQTLIDAHAAGARSLGVLQVATGQLAGALTLFVAPVGDGVFILKRGDLISDTAAQDGKWDQHVLKAADRARHARPGSAVDVGAHFGLISIPLAQRFSRVLSFEPNGFNVTLLRANAALNGLTNIECRNEPLFSRPIRLALAPSEEQEIAVPLTSDGELDVRAAPNLGAYSFHQSESGMYVHDARTLDSLGLQDLAFLKVDAQGADGEVLVGALETIGRCQPWVVFEWEEHLSAAFSVTFDDLAARFAALGYVLQVLWRHNEKQVDYLAVPAAEAGTALGGAAD